MAKSNFIVRGGADFSGIKREMDKTQKQFKGFQKNLIGGLKAFGAMAGITLGAKALYDFGKASLKVASDLEEIQNVVDVTFGAMSKDIDDFSKNLIDSHGLGELSAKKYASYMGAMLKSSGIHGEVVKDMSMDLALLTADMASFYNLETEEMFQKLMSGMTGATMPLKQLGINMNIANLEAFALSQGINQSWQEMSQAEQAMLRYNYLLEVTSDSQGDFARNSWNWAHSLKILNEKWKEFMGLVGTGLKQVLLPLLQVLIKIVDFLIKTAEALGRIYTMITGKEIISETKGSIADSNFDIGDSADDAAKSEKDLGKGIDKAAKAAKKALAPFDELNILQSNLSNSGSGGGGGSGIGVKGNDLNTSFKTKDIGDGLGDGLKSIKEEGDKIYVWLDGWNTKIRDLFKIPVMVPAPVFASIPLPIYQPEWGLTPPLVPAPVFNPILNPVYQPNWGLDVPKVAKPVFQPIPNRIYEPNWGLELPKIPVPVFPAIEYGKYNNSLESIKLASVQTSSALEKENSRVTKKISEELSTTWGKIETEYNKHKGKFGTISVGISKDWETENGKITKKVSEQLSAVWGNIEKNYKTHKGNLGIVSTAIGAVVLANTNSWLSKLGLNINNTITTTQGNWQIWGENLSGISAETARSFVANNIEQLKTTASNSISFINGNIQSFKEWGSGVLSISGETARGFLSNMTSSFRSTWNNFSSLMTSMGERVSGWFSENKSMVIKTTIAAGVVVGAGALALAAPATIPYVASALGGLSAIPALAKGGITNGEMLALIGDNPGGREVVSPLDDLLGMIQDAVSSTESDSSGDTTIIVKVGEETLTEKVVSNINRQSRINGKTIITV